MKRIGLFFQFFLLPCFICFFSYGIIHAVDFGMFTVIIFFLLDIIFFMYMFVSFSYSENYLERRFFKKKMKYELKKIIRVAKSNMGFYNIYIINSNCPKMSINFIFQKKARVKLFEYIKKENPECVFS